MLREWFDSEQEGREFLLLLKIDGRQDVQKHFLLVLSETKNQLNLNIHKSYSRQYRNNHLEY